MRALSAKALHEARAVWLGIALHGSLLAGAAPVAAATPAETRQACLDAYESGQRLRLRAHLAEARQLFLSCAQPSCPEAIGSECLHFLADTRVDLPTVVLSAIDLRGTDLFDVRVKVDGTLAVQHLDGMAIDIDPGPHLFRYEAPGFEPAQVYAVIRQGEKNRVISAHLAETPPPPPPSARRPTGAYVLGGVALAGFIGAGAFYWAARSQRDDLLNSCAPVCDSTSVDEVRTKQTVAAVSLAVGAAAAIGAATMLVIHWRGSKTTAAQLQLNAAPMDKGVFGNLAVRF